MNQKTMRRVAVAIVIVFLLTVIVYPLIFGTDEEPENGPPVELELSK